MNNVPRNPVWALLAGGIGIMLVACGYQRPAGQFTAIEAPDVYFTGVEMSEDVRDSAYPDVCVEAQDEIKTELSRRLPAKLKPLAFHVPEKPLQTDAQRAVLQMVITNCELDVDQSVTAGLFSFYLTLSVRVTLKDGDRTLLSYSMDTYEQVHADNPSPSFEFTFEEPVARTLVLFDGGRVWVPQSI